MHNNLQFSWGDSERRGGGASVCVWGGRERERRMAQVRSVAQGNEQSRRRNEMMYNYLIIKAVGSETRQRDQAVTSASEKQGKKRNTLGKEIRAYIEIIDAGWLDIKSQTGTLRRRWSENGKNHKSNGSTTFRISIWACSKNDHTQGSGGSGQPPSRKGARLRSVARERDQTEEFILCSPLLNSSSAEAYKTRFEAFCGLGSTQTYYIHFKFNALSNP